MKAKELAEQLLKHPEFEVHFNILEPDNSEWGASLRTFNIAVGDIGYSSKIIKLQAEAEL